MGKPQKRVNPKVTTRVNRDYKRLYLKKLVKVVGQLPAPWGTSPSGRPPHDAKVVAITGAGEFYLRQKRKSGFQEIWEDKKYLLNTLISASAIIIAVLVAILK